MGQKVGKSDRGWDRRAAAPRPSLGQTIRRARTEKELTLKDVAEGLGLHLAYLSNVERDRERPSIEVIDALAEFLDLDGEELRALAGRLTDEELAYLRGNPGVMRLLAAMMAAGFGERETDKLTRQVERRASRPT